MEQQMSIKRHTLIANKLLAVMSGLNRQTKREDGYYYEKHAFGLSDAFVQIKWTASLMKQMLAYMAKCNSNGTIALVSEQQLALLMNCSVRTVQNNNRLLEAKGILTWDRLWGEYIQVTLCNYLPDFLDLHKKDDQTADESAARESLSEAELASYTSKAGYTSIADEVLYLLFKVDHVNVLRLALRALLTYEKDVNVKQETEALLSYSEVKGILPRYIGYRSAIRKMADQLRSIFQVDVFEKDDCIRTFVEDKQPKPSILEKVRDGFILSFQLFGTHDSKKQKLAEKLQAEHLFARFEGFFRPFGRFQMPKEAIYSLTHEFGVRIMEKTLQSVQHDLQLSLHGDVKTFHTMIRQLEDNLSAYLRKIASGYHQAEISA
ncbi:hypothetical protein [Ectobacillus ponti]|uniref:Uncharacterized protein n=1 Tax=Ectobacillus ponti TaxID=2961894 RepID=A0AA41X5T7_9BACI|nr:hypothetical protein [Ectobacillus ponti]MCP8967385.1 hypothetical protein [Ectobacillus ponti]